MTTNTSGGVAAARNPWDAQVYRVGFLLFPNFPMACLSSVIEPLRAANEISGQRAFSWTLLAEAPGTVSSSAGVTFEASTALRDAGPLDMLLVIGPPDARFRDARSGNGAMRDLSRHGVVVGAISGGVFPLMRSGVLTDQPVSVHWCYDAAFRREFPGAQARPDMIVTAGRRPTMSWAAAAFDFALSLIADRLDRKVAQEAACWFQHPQIRGGDVEQRVPDRPASQEDAALPRLVGRCIALMAEDLSVTIPVAELARRMGVSPRHVGRAFTGATGMGPRRYLRDMRMRAARQMVRHTDIGLRDVAVEVGLETVAKLSVPYRDAFGITPVQDRDRARGFLVGSALSMLS